jgi:hypothetical protein
MCTAVLLVLPHSVFACSAAQTEWFEQLFWHFFVTDLLLFMCQVMVAAFQPFTVIHCPVLGSNMPCC